MERELCAFCGKDESEERLTKEHFVPRALWDGSRPSFTRTVPVHDTCNRRFSEDNEYFRDVFVLDQGAGEHLEVQKLLNGKMTRKLQKRPGAIVKVLQGLKIREVRTPGGIYLGRAPSFTVDWPRIQRVLINVMKGMYYSVQNRTLPAETVYQIAPIKGEAGEKVIADLNPIISQMTPWTGFGDDVFACRYVFEERAGDAMICLLQFYRHHIFLGSAISKAVRDAADGLAKASTEQE